LEIPLNVKHFAWQFNTPKQAAGFQSLKKNEFKQFYCSETGDHIFAVLKNEECFTAQ
jgi:hypothetical protein